MDSETTVSEGGVFMLLLSVENITVSLVLTDQTTALPPQWESEGKTALRSRCARAAAWELLNDFHIKKYAAPLPVEFPLKEARTGTGKPFLPVMPDFFFSLTHSGDFAAAAAAAVPVGVDLQKIRPWSPAIAARFFSEKEQEALASAADPDSAFTLLWTKKEAAAKCSGSSLFDARTTGVSFFSVPYPRGYWLTTAVQKP